MKIRSEAHYDEMAARLEQLDATTETTGNSREAREIQAALDEWDDEHWPIEGEIAAGAK